MLKSCIKKIILTEKSMLLSEQAKVVFLLSKSATKSSVKKEVEAVYGFKVASVNLMNYKPVSKNFRGKLGATKAYKKAVVTLKDVSKIEQLIG